MNTYGEIFNCENCNRQIIRGSKEDNLTELCNDCLEAQAMITEEAELEDIF